MDADALLATKRFVPKRTTLDLSKLFDEPEHTFEFTFLEPSVSKCCRQSFTRAALAAKYPEESEEWVELVAKITLCHESVTPPTGKSITQFYGDIARENDDVFVMLFGHLALSFPDLFGFSKAVDREKKDSEPAQP